MTERINARGHKNITAKHRTTFEITKESYLTLRGDCIIAIDSDKCFSDFSDNFIKKLKRENSTIEILIKCNNIKDKVIAKGHNSLILNHPTDMVIRKSNFICNRTLAINADKSAMDLDRKLIDELKRGGNVEIEIMVY
ncbi:MAG: DUF371 domain-containing protein [Candidatus Altiarchaeales archaeon]|nr:MAG: DUF371 domain-containing protein [Candidatus Altiarchaeales archaeon]